MKKRSSRFVMRGSWMAALLMLAACTGSDVTETLGLGKEAPDEFVVVSRPPLSVPPDFELTPPRAGAEDRQSVNAEAEARKALLGTEKAPETLDDVLPNSAETAVTPVLANEAPSGATSSFLNRLGANSADADIREQLARDAAKPAKKKKKNAKKKTSLYEDLMGGDDEEPMVDPAKESERLRSNKDSGKKVTDGETPTKNTKPKSVLDEVF